MDAGKGQIVLSLGTPVFSRTKADRDSLNGTQNKHPLIHFTGDKCLDITMHGSI